MLILALYIDISRSVVAIVLVFNVANTDYMLCISSYILEHVFSIKDHEQDLKRYAVYLTFPL